MLGWRVGGDSPTVKSTLEEMDRGEGLRGMEQEEEVEVSFREADLVNYPQKRSSAGHQLL